MKHFTTAMQPKELRTLSVKLFGDRWQTNLARGLGVDGSTVRRWNSGAVPIPNPVAVAIRSQFKDLRLSD